MLKTESTSINFFRFSTKCLSGLQEIARARFSCTKFDVCGKGSVEITDTTIIKNGEGREETKLQST